MKARRPYPSPASRAAYQYPRERSDLWAVSPQRRRPPGFRRGRLDDLFARTIARFPTALLSSPASTFESAWRRDRPAEFLREQLRPCRIQRPAERLVLHRQPPGHRRTPRLEADRSALALDHETEHQPRRSGPSSSPVRQAGISPALRAGTSEGPRQGRR